MPNPIRRLLRARPRRPLGAALAAIAAAAVLSACGGDDDATAEDTAAGTPSEAEVSEIVEAQLKWVINQGDTAEEDPRRRGTPQVRSVDCPDEIDLTTVDQRYECTLDGGRKEGAVAIMVQAPGTYAYRGGFPDGVHEFGSGLTVPPLVEEGAEAPTPSVPFPGDQAPNE